LKNCHIVAILTSNYFFKKSSKTKFLCYTPIMLIDDVKIKVKAGNGGDGKVAFNANAMTLGPAGGSGGRGGNIYAEAVSDLGALEHFRYKKNIVAENGGNGRNQFVDGTDGTDLILKLPVGTVIHNLDTGFDVELTKIGERIMIARGGRGGRGNFHFRSPTNTSPKEFEKGRPGEEYNLRLELKLIADVGFVGLPNIGKSTLLNLLTRAKAKVANYQFTTLEPNLGAYHKLILADIPGLIEGASNGKGLGIKFLRHIERTRILFHFLAADSKDIEHDYKTIRVELGKYNKELLTKPEYIVISKSDMVDPAELKNIITKAKTLNKNVAAISAYDDSSLEEIKKILSEIERDKTISVSKAD
jgi:GTP-binding protein